MHYATFDNLAGLYSETNGRTYFGFLFLSHLSVTGGKLCKLRRAASGTHPTSCSCHTPRTVSCLEQSARASCTPSARHRGCVRGRKLCPCSCAIGALLRPASCPRQASPRCASEARALQDGGCQAWEDCSSWPAGETCGQECPFANRTPAPARVYSASLST